MRESIELFTKDGEWRVVIGAFQTNYLFYSSAGAEVTIYHKEYTRRWYDPWYKLLRWVQRPASRIGLSVSYYQSKEAVPLRRERTDRANAESCALKLWNAGIGVSMEAAADSGLPATSTAMPSPIPRVLVARVTAAASVNIGNEFLNGHVESIR